MQQYQCGWTLSNIVILVTLFLIQISLIPYIHNFNTSTCIITDIHTNPGVISKRTYTTLSIHHSFLVRLGRTSIHIQNFEYPSPFLLFNLIQNCSYINECHLNIFLHVLWQSNQIATKSVRLSVITIKITTYNCQTTPHLSYTLLYVISGSYT